MRLQYKSTVKRSPVYRGLETSPEGSHYNALNPTKSNRQEVTLKTSLFQVILDMRYPALAPGTALLFLDITVNEQVGLMLPKPWTQTKATHVGV